MSLSRQVTVRMPRPGGADGASQWPAPPIAPEPRLTWSPLAARPLPSPASRQPAARQAESTAASGHGRHRVRRSPGLRIAGLVIGLALLGVAFGGGWVLGERWAPDHGASIAQQWQTTVNGLRDWALGL